MACQKHKGTERDVHMRVYLWTNKTQDGQNTEKYEAGSYSWSNRTGRAARA